MHLLALVADPSSQGATFNDVLIQLLHSNLGLILVVCGFVFCLIAVLGEVQASEHDAATHINPGKGGRLFGGILGVILILAGVGWMGCADYRAKADAQKAQQQVPAKADADAKAKDDADAKAKAEAAAKNEPGKDPVKPPPHTQPKPPAVIPDSPPGGAHRYTAAELDPARLGQPTNIEYIYIHGRMNDYQAAERQKAMAVAADGHGNFVSGRANAADAKNDALAACSTNQWTQYPGSCRIVMLDDTHVGQW